MAGGDVRGGLLKYNGGARPAYADEVLGRVAKYARNEVVSTVEVVSTGKTPISKPAPKDAWYCPNVSGSAVRRRQLVALLARERLLERCLDQYSGSDMSPFRVLMNVFPDNSTRLPKRYLIGLADNPTRCARALVFDGPLDPTNLHAL